MNETAGILLDLFLIFTLARVAAEVFERAHLPVVVGELLVGVLIGPHAAHLIGVPTAPLVDLFGSRETAQTALDLVYDVIGQMGLIVLLFYIGLQTPFEPLVRRLPRATSVAVPGALLTMALGTASMLAFSETLHESLFVGAALAATSVAVTARLMQGMGLLESHEGEIILAAAVVDDVLGLLILAVVSSIAKKDGLDIREISLVAVQALAFFAFIGLAARHAVSRYSLHLEKLRLESASLVFAIAGMLGLAALAAQIGLAGVVGAFLAGIVLSDSRERLDLDTQVRPIYEFLAPFFFVLTGAQVDLGILGEAHGLLLFGVITTVAIAGKVIGCGLGAFGLGARSMAAIGLGMVPRGEVGFAVAGAGLSLGVVSNDVFGVIVLMSIVTALLAPLLLKLLLTSDLFRDGSGISR